jgi:hypothetical protein
MIYYIYNNYNCHYEVIINVLEKYDEICRVEKNINDIIYLDIFNKNEDFNNFVSNKYHNIILGNPDFYDYYINCTIYEKSNIKNKNQIVIDDNKHFYISHEVFQTDNKNIWFLTPLQNNNYLTCELLPFKNDIYDISYPIYIIQGSIDDKRRNYNLLEIILENTMDYDFKIKIIGSGKMNKKFDFYKLK